MKTIFLLIFSSLSFISFSQNKTIKKYEYNRINQFGENDTFRLYYIIDSSKSIKSKGVIYYALTISIDSLDIDGFINVNAVKKKTYFISKYFHDKKSICNSYNKRQEVFRFINNSISKSLCYFGFIGSGIKMKTLLTKNNHFLIKIIYHNPIPSDKIYIKYIEFGGNSFNYPISVTFFDPILSKAIKCNAK